MTLQTGVYASLHVANFENKRVSVRLDVNSKKPLPLPFSRISLLVCLCFLPRANFSLPQNYRPLALMKAWALLASGWAFSQAQNAPPGTVDAVYQLVERVLPGSSNLLDLQFAPSCPTHLPCFSLSQNAVKISVQGSTANEIASGVGHFFREVCNMTIGW